MGPRSLARVYDIIDLFLSVYIEMLMQWIKIKLCSTLSFVMGPFLAPRRELSAPWMAGRDGERNSLLPKTNKVKGKKRCWKMMDGSTCSASGASSLTASLLFFSPLLIFSPPLALWMYLQLCVTRSALSVAARSHVEPLSTSSQPFQHKMRKTKGRCFHTDSVTSCCIPRGKERMHPANGAPWNSGFSQEGRFWSQWVLQRMEAFETWDTLPCPAGVLPSRVSGQDKTWVGQQQMVAFHR